MIRRCLALLFLLVSCTPLQEEATPEPVVAPTFPTATATRPALVTNTVAPTPPPGEPSATPDPALLSEQVQSASGLVTFRYPSGWRVSDHSDASETVITVETPPLSEIEGAFVVNVQNVGGPLTIDDLYLLADKYLFTLFGEEMGALPIDYREEGQSLLATVIAQRAERPFQFEVRFTPRPPYAQVLVLIAPQEAWGATAPLLDAMARSVAVDTGQVAALATPTPSVARQSEGLGVRRLSFFEAPTGSLYLVGEVVNESNIYYEDVQVRMTLLDAEGATVAETQWRSQLILIPPQGSSPLLGIFNDPPESWSDYRISVEGLPADYYLSRITTEFELIGVEATAEPALGAYQLEGEVLNIGEEARSIEVVGALYDAEDRVLAVESVALPVETLASTQQAPFTLTFFSKAEGEVARYEIRVEGTRLLVE